LERVGKEAAVTTAGVRAESFLNYRYAHLLDDTGDGAAFLGSVPRRMKEH
jgi:hypothetical protein